MGYNYTNGDGPSVLLVNEPNGATEPVSILDNAIRQIKAYLNDPTAGPAALIAALIPTGLIVPGWVTVSPPTGWLLCDGTAVSRTTYANLFAVIGTTFGIGNGTTTFNLPDLRDRFVKGKGSDAIADTGGAAEVTLEAEQMPKHRHGLTESNDPVGDLVTLAVNTSGSARPLAAPGAAGDDGGASEEAFSAYDKTADAQPFDNRPPYIVLTAIIKY